MKYISEANLFDIQNKTSDVIGQLPDPYDTSRYMSRQDTLADSNSYNIEYIENSYLYNGILRFRVSGYSRASKKKQEKYIESSMGGNYQKSNFPDLVPVEYTVHIKPITNTGFTNQLLDLESISDLASCDIEVFCTCRDFRYTFMNMAYKAAEYSVFNTRYGIFPIQKADAVGGLVRYSKKYSQYSGSEESNVRNPLNSGSVCKHILAVLNLFSDPYGVFGSDINTINDEIEKRKESNRPILKIEHEDLFSKYTDSTGMPVGRQRIDKERRRKIATIKRLVSDIEENNFNANLYGLTYTDDLDELGFALKQDLANYDEYYRNKVREEKIEILNKLQTETDPDKIEELENKFSSLRDENKYLPDNWETVYSDIDYMISELKYKKLQQEFISKTTATNYIGDKDDLDFTEINLDDIQSSFSDQTSGARFGEDEDYDIYRENKVVSFDKFLTLND